jgi:entericidin B
LMKIFWHGICMITMQAAGAGWPAVIQRREKRSNNMKKTAAVLALLMMGVLAGCNTMQGVGKDIERGGEKLQGTAKDTQEKM